MVNERLLFNCLICHSGLNGSVPKRTLFLLNLLLIILLNELEFRLDISMSGFSQKTGIFLLNDLITYSKYRIYDNTPYNNKLKMTIRY